MVNYLDLLNTVYTKQKLAETDDVGYCISLTKTLSKDRDNLPALKEIIPFLFYVEPKHYFYLLYFGIPQKSYIPRTIKFDKEKESESSFLDIIQNLFQYSDREVKIFKEEFNKINENKKEIKKELGI